MAEYIPHGQYDIPTGKIGGERTLGETVREAVVGAIGDVAQKLHLRGDSSRYQGKTLSRMMLDEGGHWL